MRSGQKVSSVNVTIYTAIKVMNKVLMIYGKIYVKLVIYSLWFAIHLPSRSHQHQVQSICVNKTSLSCYDDKRWLCPDGITTLAHGHYELNQINGPSQSVVVNLDDILVVFGLLYHWQIVSLFRRGLYNE